ncbi:MAG: heme ABC transporter permease CcmC [Pacificimonas sp.]
MHRYANPARFLNIAKPATLISFTLGAALLATGLIWGAWFGPADYLQGETVRILYIHVPIAWLASAAYLGLGIAGFSALVWKHPLAEVALAALAPVGATFAALCLMTGSIWGRPTWGTWWVWDGRLTSVLVLFFLYLGIIALMRGHDDDERGAKMASVLALVGLVNLPIIKFSVEWWNTLHQPASITLSGSSIDGAMLWPLLTSALGFLGLMVAIVLMRMRTLIARRKTAARAARLAMGV